MLWSLTAAAGAPAEAKVIRCVFLEPSVFSEYDTRARTFTVIDPVTGYPEVLRKVIRGASMRALPGARFEIRDRLGTLLQKLSRDHEGSDGMTDRRYPYSAAGSPGAPLDRRHDGGCEDRAGPAKD